jgi:hypothetical protein
MESIALIVPTRSRVDRFGDLKWSWKLTTGGKSRIIPIVDHDQIDDYGPVTADIDLVLSRENMIQSSVEKINLGASVTAHKYPIIGFISDDFIFRTREWEDKVIEWQTANKGICYCNDLLQGENLPTAVFMHSSLINALGYMGLPTLKHYYVDNYWLDLGTKLKRLKYFHDIIIEHQHWSNKKTIKDQLYSITENYMDQDKRTWDEFVRNSGGNLEVSKIINYEKDQNDSTGA